MADLGELIGTFLSSVAHARRIADEETTAIAEYYKDNPLLEGMSVPRIRVSELTLELPVLILGYDEGKAPILRDSSEIVKAVNDELQNQLKILDPPQHEQFQKLFQNNLLNELKRIKPIGTSGQYFQREHIVRAVDKAFCKSTDEMKKVVRIPPEQAKFISKSIQRIASNIAFEKKGIPPKIDASIITSEIKERASAGNVPRIRLVVKEEGLEWDVVERSDGTTKRTLSPE
ncbi:MAG: hypothetical protein B5M56_00750 [Desulfococcus sp. 4484_241]|nr:MAG: hypothetical protein B5M56_00750 [Desulfococcus sp. 4484_241]